MKEKIKKYAKSAFPTAAIILLLLILYAGINKAINEGAKKKGFDLLLQNQDVCTVAIMGNNLYAGGANGLFVIDMTTLTNKELGDFSMVRAVYVYNDSLWVGHDNGLTCIGNNTITFTESDGLPDKRINAITSDTRGALWVGTWGGAVRIVDEDFTVYTDDNGLADDMVNIIMTDSYGGVWFGSYVAPRGGISVYYNDRWQSFTTEKLLAHANVNAILQLHDSSVLVGGGMYTKGGGTRFVLENAGWSIDSTLSKNNDNLAGEKIRSLFEDSEGRLWVGSEYDGLAILYEAESYILNEKNGLSNNEVKVIAEDSDHNMWIGTRYGITRISAEIIASLIETKANVNYNKK